jgi:arylsulfatase
MRIRALPCLALLVATGALACSGDGEPAPDRLVLLISVDTLRADRVGAFGSDRGLTPNLDELAAEGVRFVSTYAPTAFTLPSVTTLLTGRYPRETGVVRNDCVVPADVPSLSSVLASQGFRTGAVVSNYVLRRITGLDQPFDEYDDEYTASEVNRDVLERPAADTTDAALVMLDGLRRRGGDVFLWVHYQDPHGPYTPPEELRDRAYLTEKERPGGSLRLPIGPGNGGQGRIPKYQAVEGRRDVAFYMAGYDGEVAHLDAEVGRLLDGLAERELLEDAVIAFTADHGEALGEQDYWFAHGELLSDDLLRVPLVLRVPGRAPTERTDAAGLVDVLPTLLGVLDVPAPRELRGRDLLAPGAETEDSTLFLATLGGGTTPRFGLVQDGHRFVLTRQGEGWSPRLTALGSDQALERPELVAELGRDLEAFAASLVTRPSVYWSDLSDQNVEALRALGYFGDQ